MDRLRRTSRAQWFVVGVFLVLAAFYFSFAVVRYDASHGYGDEPDYYFIGESVWHDGDLDLRNQYLNPDLHLFPAPLTFKVGPAGTPAPANFMPTSGVLLIAPANAVAGVLGVYILFALMNLVSLWLLYLVIRRMVGIIPSAITIGVAGLSVPLAWHAASIWTEVPALLCVSAVLALAPKLAARPWAVIAAGALLGFLPLLHQKYWTLALGIAAALLIDRARRRVWPWLIGLPILGMAGSVTLAYTLRGRINFTNAGTTAGANVSSAFDFDLNRFVGQPFAWFLDQTRGYLPLAPVWAVAIAGLIVLLRTQRGRSLLLTLVVGFGPFSVIYWVGPFLSGDAPPGRETLPMLPFLIIALAVGIAMLRGIVAPVLTAIVAIPSIVIGVWIPTRVDQDLMYNNVGAPKLLDRLSTPRLNLSEMWPRITTGPYWSYSRTALMTALVLLFAGALVLLSERRLMMAGEGVPISFPNPLASSAEAVGHG